MTDPAPGRRPWRRVAVLVLGVAVVAIAVGAWWRLAGRGDAGRVGPTPGVLRPGTPEPGDQASRVDATATPADSLAILRTEPPARDLNDLAVRMGRTRAASAPAPTAAPTPVAGDVAMFWLHDINSEQYFRVQARLEVVSRHAYVWVQDGQTVDRAALERGAEAFSDEVYPRVRAVFGGEWSPGIDGDPRVHVLHHEPVAGIAGYFYSADEYPEAVEPHSNQREMFYVNLSATTPGAYDYQALLAHELQHMIHWHQDRDESVWANEGLAELAARVAGYPVQTGTAFLDAPDTPLMEWEHEAGANTAHYAAAYAFFAYLRQRYGDAVIRAFVAAPANGASGVEAALAAVGDPRPFDAAFLDWAVANAVLPRPEGGVPERYSYGDLDIGRVRPTPLPDAGTATSVGQFATDYHDVTARVRDGRLALDFTGDATVGLLGPGPAAAGRVWWSNRGDNMDARLTRAFDLRGARAARLTWRAWYDLEDNWDYAYVLASGDGGATWTRLPTSRTTDANPNGNNFGSGLTGTSIGWVDEAADLTPFTGQAVTLRFEVVTDDAVNLSGLAIDDVRLDAVGFHDTADADAGWQAEGWLRLDPTLPQRWGLQVIADGARSGVAVHPIDVAPSGHATIDLPAIPPDATVTLAVSALTPATRNPAGYRLAVR